MYQAFFQTNYFASLDLVDIARTRLFHSFYIKSMGVTLDFALRKIFSLIYVPPGAPHTPGSNPNMYSYI